MTPQVVPFRILVWLFASRAIHVDECVLLGIVVYGWVSRDAEESKLRSFDVPRLTQEVLVVSLEDKFGFLVREDLVAGRE
jgi:hypothetical protein